MVREERERWWLHWGGLATGRNGDGRGLPTRKPGGQGGEHWGRRGRGCLAKGKRVGGPGGFVPASSHRVIVCFGTLRIRM